MKKRTLKNVSSSIYERLLNKAREEGRPFNEILQYFAMERFLYKLSVSSYKGKYILKGALTMAAWRSDFSRPTMDIDFLGKGPNDLDAIAAIVREISQKKTEPDGIFFDAESVQAERVMEEANYEGVRARFQGNLGSAKVPMQIDIGFGDVIVPGSEPLIYPTIIDLPAPKIECYSKESIVAEKFEAMLKLGILNSRMKDFYDIWYLANQFDFKGKVLYLAIRETLKRRRTDLPEKPAAWSKNFYEDPAKKTQWKGFLRKNRLDKAPGDLKEVVLFIKVFLSPVLNALMEGKNYKGNWDALGPWKS